MAEWISVDDKLPEPRYAVLVWEPEHQNIYTAYRECGKKLQWWHFANGGNELTRPVTHWMPLPEPPEVNRG